VSTINPRLVYWIAELYKRKQLTAAHRDILTYLAVTRLDYGTGAGYCSVRTLAEACGCHERTVRRALDAARASQPPLLARTRRGHRLGDGTVTASEWQVIYPPVSTGQPDPVDDASPVNNPPSTGHTSPVDGGAADLNRTEHASQPDTGALPTGSEASTSLSPALTSLRTAVPDATEADAGAILRNLRARGARSPLAVLRREVADGGAAALITEARAAPGASNGRKPWCGQCSDDRARQITTPQGVTRCPACHPLASARRSHVNRAGLVT
jgi:hypothetical protein